MLLSQKESTSRGQVSGYGWPWIALCLALALHVTDEALTDFLSVYNPTVVAIRQRLPLVPLPTFSFKLWLAGLVTSVILLLALSPPRLPCCQMDGLTRVHLRNRHAN